MRCVNTTNTTGKYITMFLVSECVSSTIAKKDHPVWTTTSTTRTNVSKTTASGSKTLPPLPAPSGSGYRTVETHSDNPITHHPRRERPRTQTDDAWLLQPLRRRSTGSSDRVSAATVNTHGPPATPLTDPQCPTIPPPVDTDCRTDHESPLTGTIPRQAAVIVCPPKPVRC